MPHPELIEKAMAYQTPKESATNGKLTNDSLLLTKSALCGAADSPEEKIRVGT